MITTKGKSIIAKYLIGEAQSYASYIAVGCGPKPVNANTTFTLEQKVAFSQKTSLDMEIFRVPVISRGFIVENDTAQITGAISALGVTTYTANNSYAIGQKVTITGMVPETFNTVDSTITAANGTSFAIQKTVSGSYSPSSVGVASAKISKIILTAEMPTQERYELTEIGLYSAKSNPDIVGYDSRQIFNFRNDDGWEYHSGNSISPISYKLDAIDQQSGTNTIDYTNTLGKVFAAKSSNSALNTNARILRQERPRFLEDSIFVRGDLSDLTTHGFSPVGQPHIHIKKSFPDLDRSTPIDNLNLAFSVISRDAANVLVPGRVKILMEFMTGDSDTSTNYIKYIVDLTDFPYASPDESSKTDINFDGNGNPLVAHGRYVIARRDISELESSAGFAWSKVDTVKIYVSVTDASSANADQFYVALDSLRFENNTITNPLYGLVGYTVLKTKDSKPIVKDSNKSGFVEFRYAVDVV